MAPRRQVDDYELLDSLAKGGGATTYRARRLDDGLSVILKAFAPSVASDADFRARLHALIGAARSGAGEGLEAVVDAKLESDSCYVVLPAAELGSFESLCAAARPLPVGVVVSVFRPVVRALTHLHRRKAAHSAIQPTDVLMHQSGEIRYMPFSRGLAVETSCKGDLANLGSLIGDAIASPAATEGSETMVDPAAPKELVDLVGESKRSDGGTDVATALGAFAQKLDAIAEQYAPDAGAEFVEQYLRDPLAGNEHLRQREVHSLVERARWYTRIGGALGARAKEVAERALLLDPGNVQVIEALAERPRSTAPPAPKAP